MNIRRIVLLNIRKELCWEDKIKSYIFKKYTLKIYENGFKKGFNLRRKN
jgi:hypothetical protein